MADLVVLAFVFPSYFYLDSQILKPANFEVTNLILDSDWVQVGEPLQISVNVTNNGNNNGNNNTNNGNNNQPKTLSLAEVWAQASSTARRTYLIYLYCKRKKEIILQSEKMKNSTYYAYFN